MTKANRPRLLVGVFLACLLAAAGCSRSGGGTAGTKPYHRRGAKVNVVDFLSNPAAYKGKTINLVLKVDEAIDRGQGHSLREYVGRDARFLAEGPHGERGVVVITLPAGLTVPEVGRADEVYVTFACTRGDLQQGNAATSVEPYADARDAGD